MPPATVHYGRAQVVYQQRQQVLRAAYMNHPERFVRGSPTPPELPTAVWINRPQSTNGLPDDIDNPTAVISENLISPPRGTENLPEWTLGLDTNFELELSHNA